MQKIIVITVFSVFIFVSISTVVFMSVFPLFAVAEVPNYHFTLETLSPFLPGKNLQEVIKIHGKGELVNQKREIELYRFSITHGTYRIPLYLQTYKGTILDFYLSLPSYFLHNTLHRELITKWGKQQYYHVKENSAFYQWNLAEGQWKVRYAATCTFSCYPLFLAFQLEAPPENIKNFYKPFDTFEAF